MGVASEDNDDYGTPPFNSEQLVSLHGKTTLIAAITRVLAEEGKAKVVALDEIDKAAPKFQEVVALAFFNWGNVHMYAARKRIPLDESAAKDVMATQIQVAYDWVREKYSLAREKYEEALLIKPDFYEGLLALGQQQFEMAKLHWSFALAKKLDLSG
ncbi:hypothetical protein VitviT2T_002558 [Vitis vinifera]|uniref:Uncharacterized protein n=2 Tax=Vitis vinifera TaxID=29760 RepID=A0ABY9BIV1_VITVI|nr:hypothetical protein VitviT2T_002558 [Vitis vinifera]